MDSSRTGSTEPMRASPSSHGTPAPRVRPPQDKSPIWTFGSGATRSFPPIPLQSVALVAPMTRRSSSCAICEGSNLASACSTCVNQRLNDYHTVLKSLKSVRYSLYSRLEARLVAKNKADDQAKWRLIQNEKLAELKDRLRQLDRQVSQGMAEIEKSSNDLKVGYKLLDSAFAMLEKTRVELLDKFYPNLICTQSLGHMAITSERLYKQSVVLKQIGKLFPLRRLNQDGEKKGSSSDSVDQICNVRLPKGLDPHSVPSEELAASLGYMVQLLNLVVSNLAVPALHNSGFAGSCSRIWQRYSYWDARPSSRSNEYPLFIPRQNFCSANGENSWSDKSSINFGVASVDSERKPFLDSAGCGSFNYSSASPHSIETHKDLQKGISLLKKSVACLTAYCYNSLCLDLPCDMSTFEAFGRLLAILSNSKDVRSVLSLKMACSRSNKHVRSFDMSTWQMNSAISSSSLGESRRKPQPSTHGDNLSNSAASFFLTADVADPRKSESLVEDWDFVEHPRYPPPPYQTEDVEHWTRAMFIDAKKR